MAGSICYQPGWQVGCDHQRGACQDLGGQGGLGLSAFGQTDSGRVFGAQPGVGFTFGVANKEDVHAVNYIRI